MASFKLSPPNVNWSQLNPPFSNNTGAVLSWIDNKVAQAEDNLPPVFQVATFEKADMLDFLATTNCEAVLFYLSYNQGGGTTTPLAVGVQLSPPEYLVEGNLPVMQSSRMVAPNCTVNMHPGIIALTPAPAGHLWSKANVPNIGTVQDWLGSQVIDQASTFHNALFTRQEIESVLNQPGCERLGIVSVLLRRKVDAAPEENEQTIGAVALGNQNDNFILNANNSMLVSGDTCPPGKPWRDRKVEFENAQGQA